MTERIRLAVIPLIQQTVAGSWYEENKNAMPAFRRLEVTFFYDFNMADENAPQYEEKIEGLARSFAAAVSPIITPDKGFHLSCNLTNFVAIDQQPRPAVCMTVLAAP